MLVFGQSEGVIKVRKDTVVQQQCYDCIQNNALTGSAAMIIRISTTEKFRKQPIKCYTAKIYQEEVFIGCFVVKPDVFSNKVALPPGRYNIKCLQIRMLKRSIILRLQIIKRLRFILNLRQKRKKNASGKV